uniref:Lysosomal trafficking regulator n=1 Tax=Callorhinchus milii TaxID=7868 RepID=A0A4W3ICA6_CALMI
MSSACNTLAREFLTDVHQLCNAVAQRSEGDEEESHMVVLGEYLVQGRGYLLLSTLDSIIDQELTCREELLTLLLSLLPLVWKIPVQEERAPDLLFTKESKNPKSQEKPAGTPDGSSVCSAQVPSRLSTSNWKTRRQRKSTQRYSLKDARKTQLSTSDSEVNSDDKSSVMIRQRRQQTLHPFVMSQQREDYGSSRGSLLPTISVEENRKSLECSDQSIPLQDLDMEVLTDSAALSILNKMENTPFDLCHVLLSLLRKVCKSDMALNHNPALAASVVPTLTEFLGGFGNCCNGNVPEKEEVAPGWTEEPVALVQRMLLRTVLHLMSVDINCRDNMPDTLRRNITDLLRVTLKIKSWVEKQPDPFAPRPKTTLQEVREDFSFSKSRNKELLVPELLEVVLQILICTLQTASSNPFFFSQAMDLIHEFTQHHGFELFESTLLQMEKLVTKDEPKFSEAAQHIKTLLNSIMKIISTIKKIKSEQLHHSVCTRKRHRRCEYSQFMHHHRDLSGLPVSAFKSQQCNNPFEETLDGEICYPERCCCIAVCAHQCLRMLQKVTLNSTSLWILSGIHNVGICCCMDPMSVIAPMLYTIKSQTLKAYQQRILSILTKLILEQLGGGEVSEKIKQASCNICTVDSGQVSDTTETLQGGLTDISPPSNLTSPIYRSEGILPTGGSHNIMWKWEALEAYRDLLFIDDGQLSTQVAGHICQLIQKGNAVVKWELYTRIFNSVLQRGVELSHHAQQLGVTTACTHVCSYHSKCLSQDVLQLHLHTIPSLFKSRVVRDLFLSCSGLNQMTELIYLDSVRSCALKVFETLILCLGDQKIDVTMQGQERKEDEESVLNPNDTTDTHQNTLHKIEMQQSLSKFYAELKESYPKKKKSKTTDTHLNVINLFLCVAFLCVSKETESDRDSANDSEDTSGYDSTASEPLGNLLPHLSPDSVTLPSKEQIRQASDVWSACRWIYLNSVVFRKQFYKLGGLEVSRRLMVMIIQKLSNIKKENKNNIVTCCENQKELNTESSKSSSVITQDLVQDQSKTSDEEWALQSIRLLEALLAICLHNNHCENCMHFFFQDFSVDELLIELRDLLVHAAIVDSHLAMPLFDSLQHVCLGGSSMDDYSAEFILNLSIVLQLQKVNGESVLQPSDLSEETEEPQCYNITLFAEEEGYEADSESNSEASVKPEVSSLAQSSSYFCSTAEGTISGELMYPEICMLELNLLAASNPSLDVLNHVFRNLLEVVQRSEQNAAAIYQQGAVKTILGGFQNILNQSETSLEESQRVLMELLVTLISSRLSAEELSVLMRLFLEKSPPTKILLGGILKIVEANVDAVPMQFLTFPIILSPSACNNVSAMQKLGSSPSCKSSNLLKRSKFHHVKRETKSEGYGHQLASPWHVAPLHVPVLTNISDGFSVSLWMKVEVTSHRDTSLLGHCELYRIIHFTDGEKAMGTDCYGTPNSDDKLVEDGCLHVISMGSKVMMMQVWTDLTKGRFIFRICIDPNDDMKAGLLAQAESQENVLTPGKWQHLALTYVQQMEDKKNARGKLLLWVSGQRKSEVALDYTLPRKTSLSSDSNKTFAMIGHCTVSQEDTIRLAGRWDIGSLLLFNGAAIGPEEAYYLFVCGPDFTSIMPCKYGNSQPNYSKYVNVEILQCDQIKELLMKHKKVDSGPLVESLAIVYNPRCPAQYTIYEPVIRLKVQTKTVSSQRPFSLKDVLSNVLEPQQLKTLKASEHQELQRILHEIGGTGTFIFLFARAVEVSDCEKTQALALQIVLTLAKYSQQRIQEMESCHGYAMIHQVLIKPKCIVGFHVLKTLLDGCCSAPVLKFNEHKDQFEIDMESHAVVQDVMLLSELLLDWKIWANAQRGVWETLMAALEVLIRVDHPEQMFNIRQLLKAQVVYRFLLTCQVLQEHRDESLTSIPREVCRSFVKIIQEVLGSPPDLELLQLICNFLLAVHPPTNTYVCHTPQGFYFSLHIDGKILQEKVKSITHMRYSNSGGKSTRSLRPFSDYWSPAFCFLEDKAQDNTLHSPQARHEQHSKSLPSTPSTSPQIQNQKLTPRREHSFDDLREVSECESDSRNQGNPPKMDSIETSKRMQEELYLSSCESAKTVCDSEKATSAQDDAVCPVGECLIPAVESVNQANIVSNQGGEPASDDGNSILSCLELELKQEGMGDEAINRPDSLKGLQTFQRSHSNFTSLGLAFPSQNGSLVMARWPNISENNLIPEEWESFETPFLSVTEDCLILICCGLYDLLRGILLILPDLMIPDVMDKLIHPEALIVLINHPSPLIQQGVIKLLDAYFTRASKEQKEKFLKIHGFSLLANQLYLHQGTQELLECFLKMLFGHTVGLDEEYVFVFILFLCIIPILGLIENSLYENTLVHNTLCVLLQLLNACSKLADILLDNGLLYVLFNTLAALNGLENGIPMSDYKLLLCDIQQLLVAVTIHSCSSSGSQYFRIIEDLISLLGYLQTSKNTKTKGKMAVALQFRVLQSAIEFIKSTANQDVQNLSSSYHLPATQHHAIHQKRKSIAGPRRFSAARSDSLLMRMRSVASDELTVLMQRRMSHENPMRATETEFIQRLQRLTVLSVNRLIYQGKCVYPISFPSETSEISVVQQSNNMKTFQKEMLKLMVEGIKISLGVSRSNPPRQQWKRMLWSCRDTFRSQLGRLLVHILCPSRPLEERKMGLEIVYEPSYQEILRECLGQALEQKKYENEESISKTAWEKKMATSQQSLLQRLDTKSKDISKIAAEITQNVSFQQGIERKKVIQHIRGTCKIDLSASRHWQELVQQLTHDRAIWYDPVSYPTSWQLDPTEGPNRERRRLQRCYLTIPNKYLLKDRRKPDEPPKQPLSYLFEDKTHSSFSSTVKDKATSESIRSTRACISVSALPQFVARTVKWSGMYFVEESSTTVETEPASFSWTYEEIKEVHKRWWQLRDKALEIFLTNGRTLLLAFQDTKVRDDVHHSILTCSLPNLLEYGNISALTHLWSTGQITNFEYLTHLNKHAGRSFNDLMQYPVFPFILSDYSSETLDLHEHTIYRNLLKPIAVQSKEKEDRYVENYKYLEEEFRKGAQEDDPMPPVQPYHYGSHYSNSGTVLHFLVRMPPFTKMFLAYQDQSFDIPDRTFHSMNTTWRLSSFESMTDVKELIPEFFYLPEFLVNREGFDFGLRQNGERVNHVNLPPWARNDPRLFILIHRQALESDQVSQTLCNWIDLVFGNKQKGKTAVHAINVFHPATYFGMDVSAVEDPVQRRALETMIKTYGQTPRQLFTTTHPSKHSSRLTMDGELPAAMGLLVQFAFRDSRDQTKEAIYPSPLPWIKGLKWGEYVGSPSAPDPVVCFSQPHGERFGSLLALPTRAICGLSQKFCLMMLYSKEQGVRSMHSTDIQWSAILSWGYADNMLRLKSKQSEPPVNFIQCSPLHQVTSCAWVPDSCQLFTGSKCGVVTAYSNRFISSMPSEIEVESQVYLYGHTEEVTSLYVCKPYSILISVSKDGTCIIWDLNRLCYVQSLTGHKSPVTAVSTSETTGDIATVCDSVGGGSDLRLWTVNGDLSGHVHCREIICSVSFSNQPEGVSVNVIAGGLENGVVRLWSTWDLKPVREITFSKSNRPIVSLTFSCDGHHLYTANSDGTVIAWCRKDQQRMKLPMFYSFLSNYAAG